jgi:hypothetical protein
MNSSSPDEVNISFINDLEELALKSYQLTQQNIDVKNIFMTEEQCIEHKQCKSCTNCKCKYTPKNNKVRHHDHITGDFISSICYNCNIELQYKKFLPVYIHNLKGYDSHLFVTSLFKYGYQADKSDNISCIPNNEERYISFSTKIKVDTIEVEGKPRNVMYEIRLIDTFAFMASSVESLAKN